MTAFIVLTPGWMDYSVGFADVFLLIHVIQQLVRFVIVKLSFLGQFWRDGNDFPE